MFTAVFPFLFWMIFFSIFINKKQHRTVNCTFHFHSDKRFVIIRFIWTFLLVSCMIQPWGASGNVHFERYNGHGENLIYQFA